MTEEYNREVAKHYSAYRPELHEKILSKALRPDDSFDCGVDIGCGTGKSTKPLSSYCKHVFGLDPSQHMLNMAKQESSINFIQGNEQALSQFEESQFDLITFAGSLFYAKNSTLRRELNRICCPGGIIVVYDFELLAEDLLRNLDLHLSSLNSSSYDHSVNLGSWCEFKEEIVRQEQLSIELSVDELTHFVLSHSCWYNELTSHFKVKDLFAEFRLHLMAKQQIFDLPARIFYSRYRVG